MKHTIRSVRDVTDYIDGQTKIRGRSLAIFWLALGGLFLEAYANSALGTGLGELTKQLSLSVNEVSLLAASSTIVSVFFSPIGGWMADKWGRFKPLIIAKFLAIAGAVFAAFAPNLSLLLLGRALAGAAFGVDFAVAMAILAEYTPQRFKSRLNVWQGIWYIAVCSNLLLGIGIYQLGVGLNIWRWLLGLAGVFAAVLLVLQWRFIVESPTWLARKARYEDAARSMTRVFLGSFAAAPIEEQEPVRHQADRGVANILLLFRGIYLPRTVLSATIGIGQALEYFAVGWYLPVISLQLFGTGFSFATFGAFIFNVFGILGGFLSPSIAHRLGLRRASAVGFGAVFVVLMIMGLTYGHVPLWVSFVLPSAFILFHSGGPGANGTSIATLSYRSELRATGNGFVGAVSTLAAAVALFAFPHMLDSVGLATSLMIIAIVPFIGFIVCTSIKWEPTQTVTHLDEEVDAPAFASSPVSAAGRSANHTVPGR